MSPGPTLLEYLLINEMIDMINRVVIISGYGREDIIRPPKDGVLFFSGCLI